MTKILFFILFTLGATTVALAQDSWSSMAYEATMPLYDGEKYLGDVKVEMQGEKLNWLDRYTLRTAIATFADAKVLKKVDKAEEKILPHSLPFEIKFNPQELRLETNFKMEDRGSESLNLMEDYQRRYEGIALKPAPFGGAINYRLEQSFGSDQTQSKYFNGQFDSFINMNSLVLENQMYYQTLNNAGWFRGDTRLVKDFERKQIRVQAGDVYPQVQGFMNARPMGGLNISRNFSLNPYRLPYPTGTQNFTLRARSFVKYFVNGSLVKSEYLSPGNYTAKDIPLNNGLNTILIEATDDLGQKQVFIFRSTASINLLNEGENRFDLSFGTPFIDNNFKRDYVAEDGQLASGFFQHGFTSIFSASLYGQAQGKFNLMGSEMIQATTIGNFTAGYAQSNNEELKGSAQSLSYQLVTQGTRWYQSNSLGLRFEHRSREFTNSLLATPAVIKNNYAASYTLPLANAMTVSVGGNYGDVRDNDLNDRYGFDTTINFRLLEHHNLSFFVARNRDETKQWNDVAYVFLTLTIPETNDYISALYDQQQKSTKVTHIKDNQQRLYKPRTQTVLENDQNHQSGEVDLQVPTPFADLGGRIHADHLIATDQVLSRGSLRLNSALVFAYDDGEFGMGLSRPIPGSFVIFKPEERLRDQKVGLKSTSPYTEAETGLFNEITFNNLLAYQYRDIQLDPTLLDEGRSLKKEKFMLYPTYRSAHLIKLEERGAVMLRGKIYQADGNPLSLQVGSVGGKTFFTNRAGDFFIEGLEPGSYKMTLDGSEAGFDILIKPDERGFKDVGILHLEEAP